MATIFTVTTVEMSDEKKKQLADEMIKDLSTMYKHALSFNLAIVPHENCRGDSINQTTTFICVPPYISLEKKRDSITLVNNTLVRVLGYQGQMKNIVLFQYHDDDGVGKDGELFSDIIKRREAEAKKA